MLILGQHLSTVPGMKQVLKNVYENMYQNGFKVTLY